MTTITNCWGGHSCEEKLHRRPPGGVKSNPGLASVLGSDCMGSDCMARTCSLMLHHVILEASLSSQARRLLS